MLADGTRRGAGLQALIARGASLSGHERNRTFMLSRTAGVLRYVDVSPVTGLDTVADGRAFAWLDFDHDGHRDVVLTNANEPRVQLFRNQIGAPHGVLALRFVGAKTTSEPGGASNRDAIGARVEVVVGGRARVFELRAGEGLAAQNSAELLIGLGTATSVEAIEVTWPGGRRTTVSRPQIVAGGRTALTLREGSGPAPGAAR